MQSTRDQTRIKRSNKRRNSRKKSLSPSDLKATRIQEPKKCKRSLSEGSVKTKHRKSNIRRTLSHPFTERVLDKDSDSEVIECVNSDVKCAEREPKPDSNSFLTDVALLPSVTSDESGLVAEVTSSDRDTEDERRKWCRYVGRSQLHDSGSELESLASSVVRRVSVRRRRANSNNVWSPEGGEASEPEAGRMRPEDYRLVFLSSDSSCREDNEDSSSTASSIAPQVSEDCDWDYFEPGGAVPAQVKPHAPPACPRTCSCGAEPRFVAVPVPVPVPVPAALWPAILTFPSSTQQWPFSLPRDFAFPTFNAAELAKLTHSVNPQVAAAVAAAASNMPMTNAPVIEVASPKQPEPIIQDSKIAEPSSVSVPIEKELVQIQKETEKPKKMPSLEVFNSVSEQVDGIKVIAEENIPVSISINRTDVIAGHLEAEKAFSSSSNSAESTDVEDGGGNASRSYDLISGAPEEPETSDADSDDSGGADGTFSRVFVVNPADSSSDVEDNADSSGIDCSDGDDKKCDNLPEGVAIEVAMQNDKNDPIIKKSVSIAIDLSETITNENSSEKLVIPYSSGTPDKPLKSALKCSDFIKFCDLNMMSNDVCDSKTDKVCDSIINKSSISTLSRNNCDEGVFSNLDKLEDINYIQSGIENSLDTNSNCDPDDGEMKVKVTQETPNRSKSQTACVNVSREPSPQPAITLSVESKAEEKIDLFKGIERKLSELLKSELLEEQDKKSQSETEVPACACADGETCGGKCSRAPVAGAVCRSRQSRADGCARFTSRVMITQDRVSVVTSDTTQVMRDVTVHHTNESETDPARVVASERSDEESDTETADPIGGVTVVSNADTLSAVFCLEEGLADDDSWVEDVSHDEDAVTSQTDSDSGDEANIASSRGEEFIGYCRRSLDFTLHTIVEESCEESEAENAPKKARPISATELEKYFFFGLGDGRHNPREDEEPESETSSVCSEGAESVVDAERMERTGETEELASSRLEKYFLSGFMGFSQERRDSDGSGSVGSDSEGRQSPEHRKKRLVRARGTPRSHSSSLDNLLQGDEQPADAPDVSEGSSTETEDRHDSSERLDSQGEKRKKHNKKTRSSPADERRLSTEFADETRDDTRSVSEGEDGRTSPRQEFPPLGSELSESKKQTSRDSGFVGSCDDLLRNGDGNEFKNHETKTELEEITEEIRPEVEERSECPPTRPPPSPLARKDSFNNWSSDEETNLMMNKMRQFFKTMVASANVRTSTPITEKINGTSPTETDSARKPPKPPQLIYFESELTRLMKTVPGIRDEEVREIVEYLSSEDTWSDSYDSSDYAGSDLEGSGVGRSALRRQISESCREIIDEFDRGANVASDDAGLERDAAGAYRKLVATLGRVAGEKDGISPRGSPPLVAKVMRHIGGRLVALMHEVSGGESSVGSPRPRGTRRTRPNSATTEEDDSASDASGGGLARSRSHDVLEAARAQEASDCERFSWRGSFESALLAADSRCTLGGDGARRSAGDLIAAQRSHSRSCGAIGGSEDRLWRGRRRASQPDADVTVEEETRAGSLPRLPSGATPVKSARYRPPGFRTAVRAASAPGLQAAARRRRPVLASHASPAPPSPATPLAAPASAPSLQDEVFLTDSSPAGRNTLPRRSNSPLPHDRTLDRLERPGLQARSESMASVYSGAGEGIRGAVTVKGQAHFSLLYNYRLGALEVGVKGCRDLAPVDLKRNRSDPYVKVYLLPDKSKTGKRKTKVKKNTLNPIFEETLRFVQPLATLSSRTLWLSVWHADMFGRNDFLGEVTLPLTDVVFDDPSPKWYDLQERTEQFEEQQGTRGDLIVGLKFEMEPGSARGKGTLHVLVKEAKNLVATKPSGLADVFCKSYLLPERGRLAKQKTGVVRRSLNPRWEHTFTYRSVTLQELGQRALELSLWDRDRLASNEFMGAVRLSLGTGMYLGAPVNWMDSLGKEATLWQTMLQRPNFWVEGSIPLRPQLSN